VTVYRLKMSSVCPMTKGGGAGLIISNLSKPGRLVLNILAELLRFCPNIGCSWRGQNGLYIGHCKSCEFKSKGDVFTKLDQVLFMDWLVYVCVQIFVYKYTHFYILHCGLEEYLFIFIWTYSLYLYRYMYMY
jgi:hypothetical protein